MNNFMQQILLCVVCAVGSANWGPHHREAHLSLLQSIPCTFLHTRFLHTIVSPISPRHLKNTYYCASICVSTRVEELERWSKHDTLVLMTNRTSNRKPCVAHCRNHTWPTKSIGWAIHVACRKGGLGFDSRSGTFRSDLPYEQQRWQ